MTTVRIEVDEEVGRSVLFIELFIEPGQGEKIKSNNYFASVGIAAATLIMNVIFMPGWTRLSPKKRGE